MDIYEIRLDNLRTIIGKRKHTELAERWDTSPSTLSQILGAGKIRNLGDELARRIEEKEGIPRGWLDQTHSGLTTSEVSTRDTLRGNRLRQLLEKFKIHQGLTQKGLSEKIAALDPAGQTGITQSMISQLITGKVSLTTDTLLLIAKALKISPGLLDPDLESFLTDHSVADESLKASCAISGSVFLGDHPLCPVAPSHKKRYAIAIDIDGYEPHFRKGATLIASPDEIPVPGDLVYVYGTRSDGPGLLSLLATLNRWDNDSVQMSELTTGETLLMQTHPGLRIDPVVTVQMPQLRRQSR